MPTSQVSGAGATETVILKNALESIMDDMTLTMVRTARSMTIREALDFSTAFADAQGRILVQGLTLPLHLGGLEDVLRIVAQSRRDTVKSGDVFILNDPYTGGTHLPDLYTISPLFVDDVLFGFLGTVAHHSDVGGRIPGSNASDSTEIYQEGLRIPLMHLYDGGRPNETLFTLIEANVRLPHQLLFADLRGQLAAAYAGAMRFLELANRVGPGVLESSLERLLDYSEARTRNALASIPDGEYSFTDYIDDDGIDDRPIPISVRVTVAGDSVVADFDGSSPQVRGAINCTLSFTRSAVYLAIASLIDNDIPKNDGFFRPIKVRAPAGSIVNLSAPAACAARAITGFRAADAVYGALAQALPDRVFAAGDGGNMFATFAAPSDADEPFVLVDSVVGAWGARPTEDGLQGNSPIAINIRNQSVEAIEAVYPVRIERYELVPDTGGAGRFRGGVGIRRDYRLIGSEATLQVRSDRRKVLPYGLHGGSPGKPSRNTLVRADSIEDLPSKFNCTIRRGDLFRHQSPGGGGFGDPLDRDTLRVLADVREGYVTREAAYELYGVVVDDQRERIDVAGTERRRRELRSPS